jgi:hypothetical protein
LTKTCGKVLSLLFLAVGGSVTQSSSSQSSTFDSSRLYWSIWAVVAAFGTYFCMYAFRKPFTAASFADVTVAGWSLKVVLVASQVFGYMVSKFIGIKVIAEMPPQRRAPGILFLIVAAEIALVLFGLIPQPWNAIGLFLNGLALGMVFGLVLGFLEGRKATEALAAGLCASFILADGVTKSVGSWLLMRGISEFWMPATAGLLFLPPVALGAWMLSRLPPPNPDDVAARAARAQLSREDRWSLLARYATGPTLLVVMYLAVTVLRSIRADFAPEIWTGLGQELRPKIFTQSETIVALGVLVINGCGVLIRDNRRAFFTSLLTCAAGFVLVAAALLGRQFAAVNSFGFMVLVGLGLYLPYVAMHTTIFERLLVMTRDRGNIGFLMYVADSVGYLGYVVVMILREAGGGNIANHLQFFTAACWLTCGLSFICLALTWRYFAVRCPAPKVVELAEAAV